MSAGSSRSTRSRSAPASPAISTRCISATARWSSRAICCSPSTSGRSRTRWRRRAPISPRPRPISPSPKPTSSAAEQLVARPHHHRAGVRPAHPGVPQRAGVGRGQRGDGAPGRARSSSSPSCARRSPAASATAACRPAISSPAARRRARRCSPPSCRSIRSASSSRWMRRRTCVTSASRRAARRSPGATAASRSD